MMIPEEMMLLWETKEPVYNQLSLLQSPLFPFNKSLFPSDPSFSFQIQSDISETSSYHETFLNDDFLVPTPFPLRYTNITTVTPSSPQAPDSTIFSISEVSLHQITADYRMAIGDDSDFDGIKNGDENATSLMDADDDGLIDGLDPNWHTPDSDGDGHLDGMDVKVDDLSTSSSSWFTYTLQDPEWDYATSGYEVGMTQDITLTGLETPYQASLLSSGNYFQFLGSL